LGWNPTHPGLIDDIELGHYFITRWYIRNSLLSKALKDFN
jgi:hypothetical protein